MPISFGRHRKDAEGTTAPVGRDRPIRQHPVAAELLTLSGKHATAAIEVVERAHGQVAWLYLFEGGLYSVQLEAFEPQVGARLAASGALGRSDLERLLSETGGDGCRVGVRAVEEGLVSVESLATVHQEYLLAALGAVLSCPKVKVKVHKGSVTDTLCALPLPVEPLFDVVSRRLDRLTVTWRMLDLPAAPGGQVFTRTRTPVPSSLRLPEATALTGAIDGRRALDAAAGRLGLTRAEGVHLAATLMEAGVLAPVPGEAAPSAQTSTGWSVPEAYGESTPASTPGPASAAPPATKPETKPATKPTAKPTPEAATPTPEAAAPTPEAAAPTPEAAAPPPEPARDPAPEPVPPVPEPAPVHVPEPAPAPEPEPEHVPAPAPEPAAFGGPDDHVLALRREVAAAEVAELTHALDDAVRIEREAIATAASIRARLEQARRQLAEVGGVVDVDR